MSRSQRLSRVQVIPASRSEVFSFFSEAQNLERLTPPFLNFRILTPQPIDMHAGTLIQYRLSLYGVPVRWLTEITAYEPELRFVDEQRRGPYRLWRHLHEFREVAAGTEMTDVVDYELPLGPLGGVAHALFVRRTLERIFDFRRQVVAEIFAGGARRA